MARDPELPRFRASTARLHEAGQSLQRLFEIEVTMLLGHRNTSSGCCTSLNELR